MSRIECRAEDMHKEISVVTVSLFFVHDMFQSVCDRSIA